MTHCAGYRAAALAHSRDIAAIGIDAEPHGPLPDGVGDRVVNQVERRALAELASAAPGVSWDKLLFSAKEATYKAWFPLTQRWLGFDEASISINPADGTFIARLLVPGPVLAGRQLTQFSGRWLVRDGLVITSIAVPVEPAVPAEPA
jgi:4'-phosphopantetheinyl transferase EntD